MPGPRDVVHGAAAVRVRLGLPLRNRGRGLRFGDPTARRALTVLSAALGYAHKDHKLLDPLPIGMPDKIPAGDRWLTRLQAAQLLHAALGFRKAAALGEAILHPHILRHTFATSAVMDAMPCGKVAKALGTTGRVVEDVSGHPSPKHLRGVVESVSGRRRQPKGITRRSVMRATEVSIRFFLGGMAWGARLWRQVPRRGEEVMLGGKHEGRGADRVTRVVWGVEGPDEELLGIQAVNIEVERVV